MAKKVLARPFQEEYRAYMYASAFFGLYPPGFDIVLKKIWLRRLAYLYSITIVLFAILYNALFFGIALFTDIFSNFAIFILFFRRIAAAAPTSVKLIFHAWPGGYKKMEKIYDTWNNVINVDFYVEKRQKLFAERLRQSRTMLITVLIIAGLMTQVPLYMMFFNRNAPGAAAACFPHDVNVWYHYYLVTLQYLAFAYCNLAGHSFNALSFTTMVMANVQFQILQDSLKDIFHDNNLIKSEDNIKQVRKNLGEWVKIHQATLRWSREIQDLYKFASTVKFTFLGIYIALAVFTTPGFIKEGRINELVFATAYTIGSYIVLLSESRLADELYETSSYLFLGAYNKMWSAYPKDITKSLQVIQHYTTQNPIRLRVLGIAYDNSATFLNLMQTAYQMLSFLLQMDF